MKIKACTTCKFLIMGNYVPDECHPDSSEKIKHWNGEFSPCLCNECWECSKFRVKDETLAEIVRFNIFNSCVTKFIPADICFCERDKDEDALRILTWAFQNHEQEQVDEFWEKFDTFPQYIINCVLESVKENPIEILPGFEINCDDLIEHLYGDWTPAKNLEDHSFKRPQEEHLQLDFRVPE